LFPRRSRCPPNCRRKFLRNPAPACWSQARPRSRSPLPAASWWIVRGGGGPAAVAESTVAPAKEQKLVAPVAAIGAIPPSTSTGSLPSLADIVERVSPAVVSLKAKVTAERTAEVSDEELEQLPPSLRDFFERFRKNGPPNQQRRPRGEVQGSGFVIESAGYIVTNNHVVANATDIEVAFSDGKKLKAKLIGRDELTDIALIKVEPKGRPLPAVTFADDARVRVGDWVLASATPSVSVARLRPALSRRAAAMKSPVLSSRTICRSTPLSTKATRAAQRSTSRVASSA
jgi:hypothetical protein